MERQPPNFTWRFLYTHLKVIHIKISYKVPSLKIPFMYGHCTKLICKPVHSAPHRSLYQHFHHHHQAVTPAWNTVLGQYRDEQVLEKFSSLFSHSPTQKVNTTGRGKDDKPTLKPFPNHSSLLVLQHFDQNKQQ